MHPSATGCRPPPWPPAGRPAGWWRSAPRRVRALETRRRPGRSEGETDLFIRAGFPFAGRRRPPDQLPPAPVHAAAAARGLLRSPMAGAVPAWPSRQGYRFLSFGDAMIVAAGPAGVSPPGVTRSARARAPTARPAAGVVRHGPGDASPPRASCRSAPGARSASSTPRTSTRSGPQVVLANTYHLMLRPGAETVAGPGRPAPASPAGTATCSPTPAASRSSPSTPRSTTTASPSAPPTTAPPTA